MKTFLTLSRNPISHYKLSFQIPWFQNHLFGLILIFCSNFVSSCGKSESASAICLHLVFWMTRIKKHIWFFFRNVLANRFYSHLFQMQSQTCWKLCQRANQTSLKGTLLSNIINSKLSGTMGVISEILAFFRFLAISLSVMCYCSVVQHMAFKSKLHSLSFIAPIS